MNEVVSLDTAITEKHPDLSPAVQTKCLPGDTQTRYACIAEQIVRVDDRENNLHKNNQNRQSPRLQ